MDSARRLIRQWMAEAGFSADDLQARGGPSRGYFYTMMRGLPMTEGFLRSIGKALRLSRDRQVQLFKAAKVALPWDLFPTAARLVGPNPTNTDEPSAAPQRTERVGAGEPSLIGV